MQLKKYIYYFLSFLEKKKQIIQTQRMLQRSFSDYEVLKDIRTLAVVQKNLPNQKSYKIVFIINGMPRYSGGHTSILRLGTYLCDFGHDVSYITTDGSNADLMHENAIINLPYYKGKILEKNGLQLAYDIGIATEWITSYHLTKHQHKFQHKSYFIQDYEPGFYQEGDQYYLALNSYKLGLHMISLGKWNKYRIEARCPDMSVDFIEFPFEKKQYHVVSRVIEIKEVLKVAVYIKMDARRGPFLLFQSLDLLQRKMKPLGLEVEILFFGLPKEVKLPLGKNLGKLSHTQLIDLYKSAHIGVAVSYSNISLVPFEMIASGLPVCDFRDGSAPYFFGEDTMILCNSVPEDFVERILYFVKHQSELNAMLSRAQRAIEDKTWENSAKQFCDILGI